MSTTHNGIRFTAGELEVFEKLCMGLSNREIAQALGMATERPVASYLYSMRKKMGVHSRSELIIAMFKSGAIAMDAPKKHKPRRFGKITPRQIELLNLLAEGKSLEKAAETMSIVPRTAYDLLGRIYENLEVCNRIQALLKAFQLGLIRSPGALDPSPHGLLAQANSATTGGVRIMVSAERDRLPTNKEIEVLSLIVQGYTAEEAADSLSIRVGALRARLYNSYRKLQVHNRTQAFQAMTHLGLLPPNPSST